jgi:hypothetical protein
VRATLIGPEWLTIEPIDREASPVDELGEPMASPARGTTIRIRAQVDETDPGSRRPGVEGPWIPSLASVLVRPEDAAALGWTPRDGDRVVLIEDLRGRNPRTVSWYLEAAGRTGKLGLGASSSRELLAFRVRDRRDRVPSAEGV